MAQMSKEYATALFMLAKENNAEESYQKSLETVSELFEKMPEYVEFLASPAIPMGERTDALKEAFSSEPEHVVSFLSLLCERGRIRSIFDCVKEFKSLVDFSKHVSTAKVRSVVMLSEEEKKNLSDKLCKMCGHSVIMECIIDETLMGGIVVEIDGKVIDYSLKQRLHEVKDVISR